MIVFEQHNTLLSSLASYLGMGFQIGFIGIVIMPKMRSLYNVFQDVAHITVEFLLTDLAILDTSQNAVDLDLIAPFHQVVTRLG